MYVIPGFADSLTYASEMTDPAPIPTVEPAPTAAPTWNFSPIQGALDYGSWGATDWRSLLPAPIIEEDYLNGESLIAGSTTYPKFSANGYDFVAGPSGYVTGITKDGVAVPAAHAEQLRYIGAGLLDPRYQEALTNWQSTPDKIDDYIALVAEYAPYEAAGMLGQINDRGTVGWGSFDSTAFSPDVYWGSSIQNAASGGLNYINPEIAAQVRALNATDSATAKAANLYNANMTPAAQSAADDPDDELLGGLMESLGPILQIANFIPGVNTFSIPLTAGLSLASGLDSGDFGQILSGALGLAGALGYNPLGGATSELGGLASGVPGLEFLSPEFVGPLTQAEGAIADALKGGLTGGLGAVTSGNDILEGGLAGALGSGTGSYVGSLDLGGTGSALDKFATGAAGLAAKDVVLTGGENLSDILTNAGANSLGGLAAGYAGALDLGGAGSAADKFVTDAAAQAARDIALTGGDNLSTILTNAGANSLGGLAAGATYDMLKTKPEYDETTGQYRIGDISYDAGGVPQGFFDGDIYTSYESIAGDEGYNPVSSGSLGGLAALEDVSAGKFAKAAGMGVSTLLKTGDFETALMAALPYAAGGAIDELFSAAGIDLGLDEGALAQRLVAMGVGQERAKDLAEAARTARTGAANGGVGEKVGVANNGAGNGKGQEIAATRRRGRWGSLASGIGLLRNSARNGYPMGGVGNAMRAQTPEEKVTAEVAAAAAALGLTVDEYLAQLESTAAA